jgi:hypothetical protein
MSQMKYVVLGKNYILEHYICMKENDRQCLKLHIFFDEGLIYSAVAAALVNEGSTCGNPSLKFY